MGDSKVTVLSPPPLCLGFHVSRVEGLTQTSIYICLCSGVDAAVNTNGQTGLLMPVMMIGTNGVVIVAGTLPLLPLYGNC